MTKHFLQNTKLAEMERQMMSVPNFRPPGSGWRIPRRYRAEDCLCEYCINGGGKCHGAADCVCFEERLGAGCRALWELARLFAEAAAIQNLTRRVRASFPEQRAGIYNNEEHRKRMDEAAAGHEGNKPFAAAVFLLSASPGLWRLAHRAVRCGAISFGEICVRNLNVEEYTLLQSAKDLYHGGNRLTPEDLCDGEIVSDELFRLLISAFVIRRFGAEKILFESEAIPQ